MMRILKNNKGFSELVCSLVGLLIITCMLVISLTFIKIVNHQTVLNEFGNQMIETVCDYGKTSGVEISDRFGQLEDSLQISPDISYDSSYLTGSKVQYGEVITITISSEADINILGFDRTMEFEITKTGRSKYYWK